MSDTDSMTLPPCRTLLTDTHGLVEWEPMLTRLEIKPRPEGARHLRVFVHNRTVFDHVLDASQAAHLADLLISPARDPALLGKGSGQ